MSCALLFRSVKKKIRNICLWCALLLYCVLGRICVSAPEREHARIHILRPTAIASNLFSLSSVCRSFLWQINPILLLHIFRLLLLPWYSPSSSSSYTSISFYNVFFVFLLLFCFYYYYRIVVSLIFFFLYAFRLVRIRIKEMHINKANGKSLRYLFIIFCLCAFIIIIMRWPHGIELPAGYLMWPSRQRCTHFITQCIDSRKL